MELADTYEKRIVKLRRQIHENPELALEEHETARLVSETLRILGIEVIEGVGKTGVVGLLQGSQPGKTVALRADMDALPIKELNDYEFKSTKENIMHACGHDAHTAILLGAAAILSNLKESIKGNIKFIFQPSEESPVGGAHDMINEGVLENPKVDTVVGLHADPNLFSGSIGFREGAFYAAGGGFEIEVIGKGGHGAMPHLATDAIVVASELVLALQTISSSKIDPLEPFVLTVGTINGGNKSNIIADRVTITGTLRFFDSGVGSSIGDMIENIVKSITAAHGASYKLKFIIGGKPLLNDSKIIKQMKASAARLLGEENVVLVPRTLLGEDFTLFTHLVPSAFLSLGVAYRDKENYSLHHPKFDVDESSLKIGAACLAAFAVDYLEENN